MDIWLISYAPPYWVLLFGKEATLEGLNALSYIVGHEDGATLITVIAHHDGTALALDLLGTCIDGTLKEGKTLLAEIQQHIGEGSVRAVAMDSTDGLSRGVEAVSLNPNHSAQMSAPLAFLNSSANS